MRNASLITAVAVGFFGLLPAGCIAIDHDRHHRVPVVVREPGPPPHAPAHGYRRKHHDDGVEMVFDSGIGVYVVVGQSDCWWHDDHYYRWRDGVWLSAVHVSGPWTAVEVSVVPGGLRAHKVKAKGKGKAKGSPASHRRHD